MKYEFSCEFSINPIGFEFVKLQLLPSDFPYAQSSYVINVIDFELWLSRKIIVINISDGVHCSYGYESSQANAGFNVSAYRKGQRKF